jgi:opacity protein-like surface antigen
MGHPLRSFSSPLLICLALGVLAISGWGSFAYVAWSARQQVRELTSERERLNFASGAQVGVNAQFGPVVVGVEGDLTYGGASRREFVFGALNEANVFRQDLDWLGTARARVGVALDQVLVFATGGLAFADATNVFLSTAIQTSRFSILGEAAIGRSAMPSAGVSSFSCPPPLRGFRSSVA